MSPSSLDNDGPLDQHPDVPRTGIAEQPVPPGQLPPRSHRLWQGYERFGDLESSLKAACISAVFHVSANKKPKRGKNSQIKGLNFNGVYFICKHNSRRTWRILGHVKGKVQKLDEVRWVLRYVKEGERHYRIHLPTYAKYTGIIYRLY